MTRNIFRNLALGLALASALGLAALAPAAAGAAQIYEVTVTNLTRGQVLSPPVVASHAGGFSVFTPGAPASPELAAVAEDADAAGLLALLGTEDRVHDVQIGAGPIPPGGSITVEIEGRGGRRALTVLGMLVTTNDAFYATRGRLSNSGPTMSTAIAWDAGSEANTQDCDHIPGPPCGNPGVRVPAGAEGAIHVHAGIHAFGDLIPADHDWRNPVARVTVRRLQ